MKPTTYNLQPTTKYNGFSFLEVMISIFLIVVGMLAAMALLTSGLRESIDSRSQITAGLLAQEGVEVVRNIRDNNWVASPSRLSFANLYFPPNNATGKNCIIDYSSSSITTCSRPLSEETLYLSGINYRITPPGNSTKFKRKIDIDYAPDGNGAANTATVTSMVIWGNAFPALPVTNCNTANKCAYTQVVLTKWRGN